MDPDFNATIADIHGILFWSALFGDIKGLHMYATIQQAWDYQI